MTETSSRASGAHAADPLTEALALHRAGRVVEAQHLYEAVLRERPDHPDALHLLGLLAHQRGDAATALGLIRRALQHRPEFPIALCNLANILRAEGEREAATDAYRRALAFNPNLVGAEVGLAGVAADARDFAAAAERLEAVVARHPGLAVAWCELGRARREQGRLGDAVRALEQAVALEPALFAAHNELGIALHKAGRWSDAVRAYRAALACQGDPTIALRNLGHSLKRLDRVAEAVDCYRRANAHRELAAIIDPATAALDTYATTSRAKLVHDIEQLEYLAARGWRPDAAADLIARYRGVLAAIKPRAAASEVVRLTDEERARLGPTYNRLLNVADAPALPGGPFGGWRPDRIEAAYLAARPEFVLIDDFLSAEALASLRRYCLESTVWFNFSHHGGYMAALLDDHFDCPLVLQIADALRRAMPRMLERHTLVHIWAYKYDTTLQGVGNHGDNAAVNVNFWITPDDANLSPDTGGMIIYPALAPADWEFEAFNADPDRIAAFVASHGGAPIRVPYRANRAVLFNSSLFHETDQIWFKPGYDTRRINVTMLFGDREGARA